MFYHGAMQFKQKFAQTCSLHMRRRLSSAQMLARPAVLPPLFLSKTWGEAANHEPAECGERVTLYKIIGQQASILNCSLDAALQIFHPRILRTRMLDHAASGMNRVMWTFNWPFLRPVVMIEIERLSPVLFTIQSLTKTLCTDEITQLL